MYEKVNQLIKYCNNLKECITNKININNINYNINGSKRKRKRKKNER